MEWELFGHPGRTLGFEVILIFLVLYANLSSWGIAVDSAAATFWVRSMGMQRSGTSESQRGERGKGREGRSQARVSLLGDTSLLSRLSANAAVASDVIVEPNAGARSRSWANIVAASSSLFVAALDVSHAKSGWAGRSVGLIVVALIVVALVIVLIVPLLIVLIDLISVLEGLLSFPVEINAALSILEASA